MCFCWYFGDGHFHNLSLKNAGSLLSFCLNDSSSVILLGYSDLNQPLIKNDCHLPWCCPVVWLFLEQWYLCYLSQGCSSCKQAGCIAVVWRAAPDIKCNTWIAGEAYTVKWLHYLKYFLPGKSWCRCICTGTNIFLFGGILFCLLKCHTQ